MAGVPRLVHVSTEAVLVKGDLPISDADESTPVPDDPGFYAPYSKSKAMAERLVLVSWSHGHGQWKQAPHVEIDPFCMSALCCCAVRCAHENGDQGIDWIGSIASSLHLRSDPSTI
jgi:hypothetical protein